MSYFVYSLSFLGANGAATSYDPDAQTYIDAADPGDPNAVNAWFSGLKEIGLYDNLKSGAIWGTDYNSATDLIWLDGLATGKAPTYRGGHLLEVDAIELNVTGQDDSQHTMVVWVSGWVGFPYADSNRPPGLFRTNPYDWPSDYGQVRLTNPTGNGDYVTQVVGNGVGQTFVGNDLINMDLPNPQMVAIKLDQAENRVYYSLNGGAWQDLGAVAAIPGKSWETFALLGSAGLHQAGMLFNSMLSDQEISDLYDLSGRTFFGAKGRLVVEGDSYMGPQTFSNIAFYHNTVTENAGLLKNPTNFAQGGETYLDRRDDWVANDPAAPYASTSAGDPVTFICLAGHNDLSNRNGVPSETVIEEAVEAADYIFTRAKQLGMTTICISTMRNSAINADGRVDDGSVETMNAELAALAAVDQFIDANDYFRTTYGDSYWTDLSIYDADGIHPSQAINGGYQQIAEYLAQEIDL